MNLTRSLPGLVLLVAGACGMAMASGCTLTQSPREHGDSIRTVADRDARALGEDLDILAQTDRPTRLSRWHDR